jgi:hypothetical protein
MYTYVESIVDSKEAIKGLCKFVKETDNVNIVIMKSPQRYDLIPLSGVNEEVLNFNRQLEKRTKFEIMQQHLNQS